MEINSLLILYTFQTMLSLVNVLIFFGVMVFWFKSSGSNFFSTNCISTIYLFMGMSPLFWYIVMIMVSEFAIIEQMVGFLYLMIASQNLFLFPLAMAIWFNNDKMDTASTMKIYDFLFCLNMNFLIMFILISVI